MSVNDETTPAEERFDYGGGEVAYQRPCDAGCDKGLIYSPVRFCGRCDGTGYIVRWVREAPSE